MASLSTTRLTALRAKLPEAIDTGVKRAAGMVLNVAQQLVPVDTGALKASGRVEPETGGNGEYKVIFGGDGVDYAQYVEYGNDNPNYPAQPFLNPARAEISVAKEVQIEIRKLLS